MPKRKSNALRVAETTLGKVKKVIALCKVREMGIENETSQHDPAGNQSCPTRPSQPTEASLA